MAQISARKRDMILNWHRQHFSDIEIARPLRIPVELVKAIIESEGNDGNR